MHPLFWRPNCFHCYTFFQNNWIKFHIHRWICKRVINRMIKITFCTHTHTHTKLLFKECLDSQSKILKQIIHRHRTIEGEIQKEGENKQWYHCWVLQRKVCDCQFYSSWLELIRYCKYIQQGIVCNGTANEWMNEWNVYFSL